MIKLYKNKFKPEKQTTHFAAPNTILIDSFCWTDFDCTEVLLRQSIRTGRNHQLSAASRPQYSKQPKKVSGLTSLKAFGFTKRHAGAPFPIASFWVNRFTIRSTNEPIRQMSLNRQTQGLAYHESGVFAAEVTNVLLSRSFTNCKEPEYSLTNPSGTADSRRLALLTHKRAGSLKTKIGREPNGPFSIIGNLSTLHKHSLQKFTNLCMKHGKKNKSLKIISNILRRLSLYKGTTMRGTNQRALVPNGGFSRLLKVRRFACAAKVPQGTTGFPLGLGKNDKKIMDANLIQPIASKAFAATVVGTEGGNDFGDFNWNLKVPYVVPGLTATPSGLIFLMNAIDNVKPIIEVKKVIISGTTQLVPSIIPKNRQISLAIRWIVEAAVLRRKAKKSLTLDQCFFAELIDAYHKIGIVRKRRDDLHKLAESNRGFAHYRWWAR